MDTAELLDWLEEQFQSHALLVERQVLQRVAEAAGIKHETEDLTLDYVLERVRHLAERGGQWTDTLQRTDRLMEALLDKLDALERR